MDPDFTVFAINHPETSRRRKARDWFERALEYAAESGSTHVTALPGASWDGVPAVDSFALCSTELAWRVEQSKKAGLDFGVEGHVGSITPTPTDVQKLLQDVPGLSLTLDYTHFTYLGLPDAEIEPLITHASHFHCRGGCPGRLQASFKDNVIDYRRVLRVMENTGYEGYFELEYVWTEWQHCNEVDNLSETILFRDFILSQQTG
jgi:sugar phosphate isomerase/epimerase